MWTWWAHIKSSCLSSVPCRQVTSCPHCLIQQDQWPTIMTCNLIILISWRNSFTAVVKTLFSVLTCQTVVKWVTMQKSCRCHIVVSFLLYRILLRYQPNCLFDNQAGASGRSNVIGVSRGMRASQTWNLSTELSSEVCQTVGASYEWLISQQLAHYQDYDVSCCWPFFIACLITLCVSSSGLSSCSKAAHTSNRIWCWSGCKLIIIACSYPPTLALNWDQ